MQESIKPQESLKQSLQKISQTFKDDLHQLGLGEVEGEESRDFDFENYGLKFEQSEVERGEFKFEYDLMQLQEMIKELEVTLKVGGEEAWQMTYREGGRFLAACFAGLEYLEDPKEAFATLVFRLTKNHPCEDGNKRISSVMFVLGLLENGMQIEEIKQNIDLEEFGMVMSQIESEKGDEVREKINKFLAGLGDK